MRKLISVAWALVFLLISESCSKEKVQPTVNNKANTTAQPASAPTQPASPPSSQPPSCGHASGNPTSAAG